MDRRHWTGYGCLITVVIYKAYLVAFAVGIPKPTISVEPTSVQWGGKVTIKCTIRDEDYQQTKGTFFFKKTNTEKKGKLVSFLLSNVKFEDEEPSNCCYRWNDTESCSTVKFKVTVDLQKPTISASLDQKQWSSSGIQVTRGDGFVINCSTSANYPEGQFLLWFSGTNSSVSVSSVNHSVSFSFPVSQNQHHGQYSCVYQVTGAGRTYKSPRSAVVVVTVKEPLLTIILPVVAVILLLLLLIGLYCLHRRRRQRVTEFTPSSPAPMMAINQYEESDDEEEADYVNAPNEREDEDSDGPDYVNVTAVSDRYRVDIYGGSDDNVYQNI